MRGISKIFCSVVSRSCQSLKNQIFLKFSTFKVFKNKTTKYFAYSLHTVVDRLFDFGLKL